MTGNVSVASAFPRPWSSVGIKVAKIKREPDFCHAWPFLVKKKGRIKKGFQERCILSDSACNMQKMGHFSPSAVGRAGTKVGTE